MFFIFLTLVDNLMGETKLKPYEFVVFEISRLEESIYMFQIDMGRFPTTEEGLEALFRQSLNASQWKGPYIGHKANRVDVWNTRYVYIYPSRYGDKTFDLYSFGKNRKDDFGRGDDISNWRGFNPNEYDDKKIRRLTFYAVVVTILSLLGLTILWIVFVRRNKVKREVS